MTTRCFWAGTAERMMAYHDTEWGVPLHDDRKHFEFIVLDGAQAGLSWSTILNKRDNYRAAFDHFDPKKVAAYGPEKIASLLADAGIVRNKLKINVAVQSAKSFLQIQKEFKTFDAYIWQFTGGKTIQNKWKTHKDIPAKTREAEAMSKDLLKRGFKFVGPTICYAYMQAAGMVNDHTVDCFRYRELKK
ncbi:MAG: DNA-3-methyladenine glycosylase I [Planctomycetota bacterium]